MVFNGTGVMDVAFYNLSAYVFGSNEATGVFFLMLLFTGAMMLRIDFFISFVALLPVSVVLFAFGMVHPIVVGLHVVVVFITLGSSFMRNK